MDDLAFRTQIACNQFTRYAGAVASAELADVLDALAAINDDVWHGRDPSIIKQQIEKAKALLDAVMTVECGRVPPNN